MSPHLSFFFTVVIIAVVCGFYRVDRQAAYGPPTAPAPVAIFIGKTALPDFTLYQQVGDKKQAFFAFMMKLINQENTRVLVLRHHLEHLSTNRQSLSAAQQDWLLELGSYYKTPTQAVDSDLFESLLVRVDVVPVSLVLAQAANESAWGTSRFAVKGNNLFGQWCFNPGCGLVPSAREKGANHEVASFKSAIKSVESYVHNLNTHRAYAELRGIRARQRQQNKALSGLVIAQGLSKYSSRGNAYVEEIQQLIRLNKLTQYDTL